MLWQQSTVLPCCNTTSWTAGPLSQLPEHIAALVKSVKQGHEELLQGQEAQAGLAAQHLHTLRDLVEGLVSLLHDHKLGSQQVSRVLLRDFGAG